MSFLHALIKRNEVNYVWKKNEIIRYLYNYPRTTPSYFHYVLTFSLYYFSPKKRGKKVVPNFVLK